MVRAGIIVGIIIIIFAIVLLIAGIYELVKENKTGATFNKGYNNLGWGLTLGGVVLLFSGIIVIISGWRLSGTSGKAIKVTKSE